MSKVKYAIYEIISFETLLSKMADLERDNYLVEITPISNDNGEITKYFVFAKKSASKKQTVKVELEKNKSDKLFKFYG